MAVTYTACEAILQVASRFPYNAIKIYVMSLSDLECIFFVPAEYAVRSACEAGSARASIRLRDLR